MHKNSRGATLVASPFTTLPPGTPLFAFTDICAFPIASPSWKKLKKNKILSFREDIGRFHFLFRIYTSLAFQRGRPREKRGPGVEDIAGLVARPNLRGQHVVVARSPAHSRHVRALYMGHAWPTLSFPPKIAPVTRATLLSRTGSYRRDSGGVGKPSGRSLIHGCMHKRVYLE